MKLETMNLTLAIKMKRVLSILIVLFSMLAFQTGAQTDQEDADVLDIIGGCPEVYEGSTRDLHISMIDPNFNIYTVQCLGNGATAPTLSGIIADELYTVIYGGDSSQASIPTEENTCLVYDARPDTSRCIPESAAMTCIKSRNSDRSPTFSCSSGAALVTATNPVAINTALNPNELDDSPYPADIRIFPVALNTLVNPIENITAFYIGSAETEVTISYWSIGMFNSLGLISLGQECQGALTDSPLIQEAVSKISLCQCTLELSGLELVEDCEYRGADVGSNPPSEEDDTDTTSLNTTAAPTQAPTTRASQAPSVNNWSDTLDPTVVATLVETVGVNNITVYPSTTTTATMATATPSTAPLPEQGGVTDTESATVSESVGSEIDDESVTVETDSPTIGESTSATTSGGVYLILMDTKMGYLYMYMLQYVAILTCLWQIY